MAHANTETEILSNKIKPQTTEGVNRSGSIAGTTTATPSSVYSGQATTRSVGGPSATFAANAFESSVSHKLAAGSRPRGTIDNVCSSSATSALVSSSVQDQSHQNIGVTVSSSVAHLTNLDSPDCSPVSQMSPRDWHHIDSRSSSPMGRKSLSASPLSGGRPGSDADGDFDFELVEI